MDDESSKRYSPAYYYRPDNIHYNDEVDLSFRSKIFGGITPQIGRWIFALIIGVPLFLYLFA